MGYLRLDDATVEIILAETMFAVESLDWVRCTMGTVGVVETWSGGVTWRAHVR